MAYADRPGRSRTPSTPRPHLRGSRNEWQGGATFPGLAYVLVA
ncbi:hypothetical protein SAMN05216188_10379 [Lentzea xinjiangensis]|uniref:Uncharacterized protein n=1 Tax=Lentzea xinjiangensis TaxID=402600 RepID=A0A1H9G4W1_9PSEU|nr:hypothetical protein SAMN05216188_10379 [Lentzea xinjiangensis]